MDQLQDIFTFIFDAEIRAEIIVSGFILIMFYFAYLDQKSFKEDHHTDYKSLIVSTGVLGTFLGIFLGLQEFDSGDIKNSVPTLLDGLKIAFATSIMGMFISIFLSFFQKGKSLDADDDIGFLKSINNKLDKLDSLKSIDGTSKEFIEQLKNFRMELRDEQLKLRNFIEHNFTKTNESLERAIEALSRGATEEIIKALNKVISDFNENLKEQFGENFKQLNEAVFRLIEWQDNYRTQVEENSKFLSEIRDSLSDSKTTIGEVANKNQETLAVYQNLGKIIET